MRRKFSKAVVYILFLSILMISGCSAKSGNTQVGSAYTKKSPSDFSFVLNYGVGAKNQIDTFKGTYTKDMIPKEPLTTKLRLTNEEMNEIYSEMEKINIFSYPEKFNPGSSLHVTPFETYSIKIKANGKEKNIYWEDENLSNAKEAAELRDLIKKVEKIIYEKEEYKKLPMPEGGYD